METDNVIPLPAKLERLSKRIKKNLEVGHKIRAEWIESKIEMARDLLEARIEFGKNDRAFHDWLTAEGLGDNYLPRHDRIALIAMASDLDRMRAVFKATTRWSPQHIHQNEWDVASREARSKQRHKASPGVDKARDAVRASIQESGGAPTTEVAEELNLDPRTVQRAILAERSYFDGVEDGKALALREHLTKAQAHHIDRLVKIEAKRLAGELAAERAKLHAEIKAEIDRQTKAANDRSNEQYQRYREEQLKYQKMINNHKPPFTMEEFRTIVMVLHPDNSASEETRARALQSFVAKKLQLTGKR